MVKLLVDLADSIRVYPTSMHDCKWAIVASQTNGYAKDFVKGLDPDAKMEVHRLHGELCNVWFVKGKENQTGVRES